MGTFHFPHETFSEGSQSLRPSPCGPVIFTGFPPRSKFSPYFQPFLGLFEVNPKIGIDSNRSFLGFEAPVHSFVPILRIEFENRLGWEGWRWRMELGWGWYLWEVMKLRNHSPISTLTFQNISSSEFAALLMDRDAPLLLFVKF